MSSKSIRKILTTYDLLEAAKQSQPFKTNYKLVEDLIGTIQNGPDSKGEFYLQGEGDFKAIRVNFIDEDFGRIAVDPKEIEAGELYWEKASNGSNQPVIELSFPTGKISFSGKEVYKRAFLVLSEGEPELKQFPKVPAGTTKELTEEDFQNLKAD